MADIQVHCGSCGNGFTVSEDMAGLIATCPKCERQLSVPLPNGIRESRPKLQMKKEGGTVAGGKRCPACNGGMAAEAVICVQCGYDTRTGNSFAQQGSGPKMVKPILALLGIVIIAGFAWSFMRSRSRSGIMGDPPPPPVAPVVAAPTAQPSPEILEAQPVDIREEDDEEFAGEEIQAESGPSLEEIQQMLKTALDNRHPMYTPGSAVVLRRTNGLVHRGELISINVDSLTLQTEEGQIQVLFDTLDHQTRLLCDSEFRKKYLEHRAKAMRPFVETL